MRQVNQIGTVYKPGSVLAWPKRGSARPPVNTVRPVVTGTFTVGQVLTCGTGTFTGGILPLAYQWYLDSDPLPGKTATTITLLAGYAGLTVFCVVRAGNVTGYTYAPSNKGLVSP